MRNSRVKGMLYRNDGDERSNRVIELVFKYGNDGYVLVLTYQWELTLL